MVLAILLILARNGYYMVEQPSQSLLWWHTRWQWLANIVTYAPDSHVPDLSRYNITYLNLPSDSPAKVFEVRFWMMHWGAKSSKRTIFSGNLASMTCLDKGTLKATEIKKKQKATTTRIFHACLGWFWDRMDIYNSSE